MIQSQISKIEAIEIGKTLVSWDLSPSQLNNLEMILNGAVAPIYSFMTQDEYNSVLQNMRLTDGKLCPIPITLDVDEKFAMGLEIGQKIALRDWEGVLIAFLTIASIWQPNRTVEALKIFGTHSIENLEVDNLINRTGEFYLGGQIEKVELPHHYDYSQYRRDSTVLKTAFQERGWDRIIAYHSSSVIHNSERKLIDRKAKNLQANILINISVGDEIEKFTRVRCHEQVIYSTFQDRAILNILPRSVHLSRSIQGIRQLLSQAIVSKNLGCTHLLVEQKKDLLQDDGEEIDRYAEEIGIQILRYDPLVYVKEKADYLPKSLVADYETILEISDTDIVKRLRQGLPIPNWFSVDGVVEELKKFYLPTHKQGLTIFFTGLSGSGKSTIANGLAIKLLEIGGRPVTLLDGDVVRKNLSSELNFSKEHRDLNIRRIGFVANEITKNGGIAICAPIAPYADIRREIRHIINQSGGFVEIYISTPIEECEKRDRKGLYAKARSGLIKGFTGIDDPYEVPISPELELNTSNLSPDDCIQRILLKLENLGFIQSDSLDFFI